jgi:hypothetical protein
MRIALPLAAALLLSGCAGGGSDGARAPAAPRHIDAVLNSPDNGTVRAALWQIRAAEAAGVPAAVRLREVHRRSRELRSALADERPGTLVPEAGLRPARDVLLGTARLVADVDPPSARRLRTAALGLRGDARGGPSPPPPGVAQGPGALEGLGDR